MGFYNALLENPGIEIFGFRIYAYAIIIVCGMVAAFFVISRLFRRRNMSKDLFLTYFCVTLPVALVTTRLFYCITGGVAFKYWFSFTDVEHGIRAGGLSIIGGILGGTIAVAAVSYFKKVNFLRAADCIVVGLLLAQAIGRWGNFANQEVYGAKVTAESLQFFPFAVYINHTADGSCLQSITLTFAKIFGSDTDISGGTWHYAFFFYESFINLIGAILLFLNAWKNPKKPNGVNFACYLVHYGLVRSIMEPLRDPSYILDGGGVRWSFVMSLIMLIGGLGLLAFLLWNNKRREGSIFGSKSGDPYGIAAYIKDAKDEVAYLDKRNIMCAIYPENYVKPQPEDGRETPTPQKNFWKKPFASDKKETGRADEKESDEKADEKTGEEAESRTEKKESDEKSDDGAGGEKKQ